MQSVTPNEVQQNSPRRSTRRWLSPPPLPPLKHTTDPHGGTVLYCTLLYYNPQRAQTCNQQSETRAQTLERMQRSQRVAVAQELVLFVKPSRPGFVPLNALSYTAGANNRPLHDSVNLLLHHEHQRRGEHPSRNLRRDPLEHKENISTTRATGVTPG